MLLHFRLFLGVLGLFFLVSCSPSKSQNSDDVATFDDDFNLQDVEIVNDYDDASEQDTDSDTDFENHDSDSEDEKTDNEIFEETEPINGYKRCYDKIPAGDYEGFFANPYIESSIKLGLGYGYYDDYEIKEEDLAKVQEITVYSQDLRVIEKLVNIKKIQISGENVYDFTPLAGLTKLKELILYSEYMTCLDGSLSLLNDLETLEIRETKLKDVSPIERLENLTSLDLDKNQIEFLPENIGNLQKLEYLTFSYNNVQDIEGIKSLTNLQRLGFTHNRIENILPIRNMTKLIVINFSNNTIADISAVENFTELESLGANNNKIEILPDFQHLGKLQRIYLDYNNISSLPNLKGLDSLEEMWLAYNNLNDEEFGKLDELEHAGFLDVSFNKITKVSILKNLKSLKYMLLVGNEVSNLSGFADNESFPALKQLDLQFNKIENAEPLRERKKLSRLSIYNNCIKDISPLKELQENGTHVSGIDKQLESCDDTTTLGDGE